MTKMVMILFKNDFLSRKKYNLFCHKTGNLPPPFYKTGQVIF
jgi:hypothetical protein